MTFILKRLADLPFITDSFFKYLSLFANRKYTKEKIVSFLSSRDNIYDWQEMWLLLILSKAKNLESEHLDVVRDIVRGRDKHWASRLASIFVLGKLGDNAERNWLKNLYPKEDNLGVKRAIAVSVHGLPKATRNRFYSEIESDSDYMKRLTKYLKNEQIETI